MLWLLHPRGPSLDVLRAELENHRAVADSVTSAIEEEIAELESATETEHEPSAETAATRDHGKRDSLASTAGRVLGFLSVGFAMAAFLAWTDAE